jgi:hypothetical protein
MSTDELERVWKKAFVAYLTAWPWYLSGGTDKNHETSQGGPGPGDWKGVAAKCMSVGYLYAELNPTAISMGIMTFCKSYSRS